MQCYTRSWISRALNELKVKSHHPPTFGSVTSWDASPSLFHIQCRNVRMKRWSANSTYSVKRDEMMIEGLQAKVDKLKAQIKAEEREEEQRMKQAMYHGDISEENDIPSHNYYFWENVLTEEDRSKLASHGISTVDELFAAYQSAEAAMSRPHARVEKLPAKFRIARQFYKDIPRKLFESGIAKAKAAGRP